MNILLLEDDVMLNEIISEGLREKGYEVDNVYNGKEAENFIYEKNYDLLLFDINVPYMNGFELLKQLRESKLYIPIIYITSLNDIESITRGFNLGCSDYIKKPFEFEELELRIENIKKIFSIESDEIFWFNEKVYYNFKKSIIVVDNEYFELSKMEKLVLEYFIKNLNRTISIEELALNIWTYDDMPTDSTVRTYIKNIRKKIGKESIKTIKGVGYYFDKIVLIN